MSAVDVPTHPPPFQGNRDMLHPASDTLTEARASLVLLCVSVFARVRCLALSLVGRALYLALAVSCVVYGCMEVS